MKLWCMHATEVEGHGVVRRGDEIELPDQLIDERIAANFRRAEDRAPISARTNTAEPVEDDGDRADEAATQRDAKIGRVVSTLGREGLTAKLQEAGITYPPRARTEYLAKLWLVQQGELTMED